MKKVNLGTDEHGFFFKKTRRAAHESLRESISHSEIKKLKY